MPLGLNVYLKVQAKQEGALTYMERAGNLLGCLWGKDFPALSW